MLEQTFQHLYDRLNPIPSRWWDTVYINNKTFVKLSLVCKEWHHLAKPFRTAVFIASEKGAKRFLSTFRKANLRVDKLHYAESLPEDLLAKVLSIIPKKTLSALSIPVDMIQGKHVYQILKNEGSLHPIQSLHIHGKLSNDYQTTWWKRAYVMHNIPTLTELSLTGLYIKGVSQEVSAAVLSPIKKLQLERLRFQSPLAIEHLCRHIVYHLKEVRLSNMASAEIQNILLYLGTSWAVLHRLELVGVPNLPSGLTSPIVVDTETGELPCTDSSSKNDRLDRLRALATICRQLRFETAAQINFFKAFLQFSTFVDDKYAALLPLPDTFKLRKELDEDRVKAFQQAYTLLTGSYEKPTIVDPPEFFDIYEPFDDSGWWDPPWTLE